MSHIVSYIVLNLCSAIPPNCFKYWIQINWPPGLMGLKIILNKSAKAATNIPNFSFVSKTTTKESLAKSYRKKRVFELTACQSVFNNVTLQKP